MGEACRSYDVGGVNRGVAIEQACAIVLEQFQKKRVLLEKQIQSETLILLGLGAFFFWAFNQK